jgi:hypothetical protein
MYSTSTEMKPKSMSKRVLWCVVVMRHGRGFGMYELHLRGWSWVRYWKHYNSVLRLLGWLNGVDIDDAVSVCSRAMERTKNFRRLTFPSGSPTCSLLAQLSTSLLEQAEHYPLLPGGFCLCSKRTPAHRISLILHIYTLKMEETISCEATPK